jgi:hypothetical protein
MTEENWRRLDVIAAGVGSSCLGEAVSFLIRQQRHGSPISHHRTDDTDAGKQSERLTLRISENDKKTLDLIAKVCENDGSVA